MKFKESKNKILFVALFIIIVVALFVTMLVILIFGVFNNKADNAYLRFKDNIIVENINQKIHVKDLLSHNIEEDFVIDINSSNSEIVGVEGEFISLNKNGCTSVTVKTKYLNKEFTDNAFIVVVDNINNEEEIKNYISLESYKNLTLKVNEEIDLEIAGGLGEVSDISLSNSGIQYNKEENKLIAITEGVTTLSAKINYQTKSSLKPISICSSVDFVVESDISELSVKVLDNNFNETIEISYDKNDIGKINGYFLIQNVKYLKYENLDTDFNFCVCGEPIIRDNKFLIPFSVNNWGNVDGKIEYSGRQGNFSANVSFNSYNQDVTYFPDRVELVVNIYSGNVYAQVKPYYNENYIYAEYEVLFICDGVESTYENTSYISNFAYDGNTCIFKINTDKTFSIKAVLKHLPKVFATEEIIPS